jgi:hypothetical protein
MKHSLLVLTLGAALTIIGCGKKDSANNPLSAVNNSGGNQTENITFVMHMESGTQGMIFFAVPSEDVKLTKIDISFPAQQFSETLNNPDPNHLFSKGTAIQLNEYTGIETHQQWVLKFYGTSVKTGKPFTVTVNWDVV